jgi:hypothetical protein
VQVAVHVRHNCILRKGIMEVTKVNTDTKSVFLEVAVQEVALKQST